MKTIKVGPLAGIDNASERDDALQVGGEAPALFLRDALNVLIDNGRASMRPGRERVTATPYEDIWQSPLHGDVFGRLGGDWVRIEKDWSHRVLMPCGEGRVGHLVLNGRVVAGTRRGLLEYNGIEARALALPTPPPPLLSRMDGSLVPGHYEVAIAWVRDGMVSPLSSSAGLDADSGISIAISPPPDDVDRVRVFVTKPDGGELLRLSEHRADVGLVPVPLLGRLGEPARFRHCVPMPAGDHLGLWQGRLVVASGRQVSFSQALAYHVHDPRHDFVTLPERVTFLAPVESGIWVGQVTHAVFLGGTQPQEMRVTSRHTAAPIPGSAAPLPMRDGHSVSEGAPSVGWLSERGYVLASAEGGIIEPQAARLRGIHGSWGSTVVENGRLTTATV